MKIRATKPVRNDGVVFQTLFLDSDSGMRSANIEIWFDIIEPGLHWTVSLYKLSGTRIDNIRLESWRKAKTLALAWLDED